MSLKIRRRTAGILLGLTLGVSSLAACGMPASAVAQIDGQTISVQEFEDALTAAYADPIIGEAAEEMGASFRTSYLNDWVSYEIARVVAANAGVTISDAEVEEEIELMLGGQSIEVAQQQSVQAGQPFTADQVRMRVATNLVSAKFGEEVTGTTQDELAAEKLAELKQQRESAPESFTTYNLLATVTYDQELAQDWIEKANGGMTLEEAIASNPDPNTPVEGVSAESYTGAELAQQPDVLNQLQAIEEGQTGAVMQGPDQMGQFVFIVVTMDSIAITSDEELQAQADQAAQQEFFAAGMAEAAAQAQQIDIEVNPRYGKVEFPQQGLPSITVPTPGTFTEPSSAADTGLPPGLPLE